MISAFVSFIAMCIAIFFAVVVGGLVALMLISTIVGAASENGLQAILDKSAELSLGDETKRRR